MKNIPPVAGTHVICVNRISLLSGSFREKSTIRIFLLYTLRICYDFLSVNVDGNLTKMLKIYRKTIRKH